jgi:NAD(P)-dependent dehydrogenase (short-subunit alcohol dehydrogenase family)
MTDTEITDLNRVLVLGGQGVFGSVIAEAFAAAGWTALRAGRRPDPGADFRHVDLDEPETVEKALGEADLIVSTIPDERLVTERLVLDRGGLLINVSAMPARAARRLRREPGEPQGTVLMNAGIAPGLTNLIAADLLAQHPEADEVELVFTVSAKSTVGPAGASFAHRSLTGSSRHHTTVVCLPEPYGRRRCLGFAESDGGWLGAVADGRTVSPYLCIGERRVHSAMLAFNSAGIIGRLPRSAFAGGSSGEAGSEPIAHWVAVRRRGALLAARTLRCRGDYLAAAAGTVLFARSLAARSESRPAGAVLPEEIAAIGQFRPALATAGIVVVDEQVPGESGDPEHGG